MKDESPGLRLARNLYFGIALCLLGPLPWFFGGMGPDGAWFLPWAGKFCLLPLALWLWDRRQQHKRLGTFFWLALSAWSLLALQVLLSLGNPSHLPQAPWVGEGFDRLPFTPWLPSTVFTGATLQEGHLLLAYGLLALTARCVGLREAQGRALLWLLAGNASLLALVGLPFHFLGTTRILGLWQAPESYFYSTFLYHNHWAPFAFLGLGALVKLANSAKEPVDLLLPTALTLPLLISIPVSVSRLGMLVFGLFGLLYLVRLLRRDHPWSLILRPTAFSFLALLALAVLSSTLLSKTAGQRSWSYIAMQNPFALRLSLAEDTLNLIADKPLWGHGLGSFGAAFREYQKPQTIQVASNGLSTRYEHPHNDALETLAELGFLGTFALLLPFGYNLYRFLHLLPHQGPPAPMVTWLLCLVVFALGDMAFVNRCVCVTTCLLFPLFFPHQPLAPCRLRSEGGAGNTLSRTRGRQRRAALAPH